MVTYGLYYTKLYSIQSYFLGIEFTVFVSWCIFSSFCCLCISHTSYISVHFAQVSFYLCIFFGGRGAIEGSFLSFHFLCYIHVYTQAICKKAHTQTEQRTLVYLITSWSLIVLSYADLTYFHIIFILDQKTFFAYMCKKMRAQTEQ